MGTQQNQDPINNVVSDTIVKISDTLYLHLNNTMELFQGDENLVVKTISEPKSGVELLGIIIGIIAGVVAVVYTFIALKKLLSNDKQLQSQIDELVKLNKLFERRLRMSVKPHLYMNGSGYHGSDWSVYLLIFNRGEIAFYHGFEILEGENTFNLPTWEDSIWITKEKPIELKGKTSKHPKDTCFKIKIQYSDKENYMYESVIEWNRGIAKMLETIEL